MAVRLIPADAAAGAALWLALAMPGVRAALEADMALHMLVQLPLLTAAGWLAAGAALPRAALARWDDGGWTGIAVAALVSTYWMLPRALDAALASPLAEAGKFLSLPLLVGLPLRWSWPRLSPLGRGFMITNAISMLAFAGWLYIAAPVRVCVYYLADQQIAAGQGLLWAALLGGIALLLRCLAGPSGRAFPSIAAPAARPPVMER